MPAGKDTWKACYLEHIDRDACYRKISTWPRDVYLSAAADICEHFCYFESEFGFTLIEALIRLAPIGYVPDPHEAFHELHDIVWNAFAAL